jgi:hypothetical protein
MSDFLRPCQNDIVMPPTSPRVAVTHRSPAVANKVLYAAPDWRWQFVFPSVIVRRDPRHRRHASLVARGNR